MSPARLTNNSSFCTQNAADFSDGVLPLQDDEQDWRQTPDYKAFRRISLALAAWTVPLGFSHHLLLFGVV